MVYRLWDKKNERFLTEDECWNIGIRNDGRIIEYDISVGWGSCLSSEDVTDKYDIHIDYNEELSK